MASARTRSAIRSMGLENIRFAMRSILVQRLRSFLTLLGIVSGVATVIAMVSFVAGFNDAITGAFSSFGTHPGAVPEVRAALRRAGRRARGAAQPARPDPGGRPGPEAAEHPGRRRESRALPQPARPRRLHHLQEPEGQGGQRPHPGGRRAGLRPGQQRHHRGWALLRRCGYQPLRPDRGRRSGRGRGPLVRTGIPSTRNCSSTACPSRWWACSRRRARSWAAAPTTSCSSPSAPSTRCSPT